MDFLTSEGFRTAMHVAGRAFFAMAFIGGGMNHFMKLDDTTAYAASRGVPAPKAATVVTGLMMVVGGVFILLGWHRFIGAGLVFLFLIWAAFMMHNFWRDSDPAARKNEMSHFMKNIALAGAALLIAFYSGWSWPTSLGG